MLLTTSKLILKSFTNSTTTEETNTCSSIQLIISLTTNTLTDEPADVASLSADQYQSIFSELQHIPQYIVLPDVLIHLNHS